jgi:hypothetical protein
MVRIADFHSAHFGSNPNSVTSKHYIKPVRRITMKSSANIKKSAKARTQTVLVLRTCDVNMSAYGGFKWPEKGFVKCDDWDPIAKCGRGLHGFLWGRGDGSLAANDSDAKWLVVKVIASEIVPIGTDKVKFPKGYVVFCGSKGDAAEYIKERAPTSNIPIIGLTATAGDAGTATAGYRGTATAGYAGTATAGYAGTATAGYRGTATAGDRGTATAGYAGTATAGYAGTATAGDAGTATAGYRGTATAGYAGTATAGYAGTIIIKWYDYSANRYRFSIGYVGENLKQNVKYAVDKNGNFIEILNTKKD